MSDILKLAREHQLKQEHIKLQKENKLLREALEFYADTKNYVNFHDQYLDELPSEIDFDEGEKARKVLKK